MYKLCTTVHKALYYIYMKLEETRLDNTAPYELSLTNVADILYFKLHHVPAMQPLHCWDMDMVQFKILDFDN